MVSTAVVVLIVFLSFFFICAFVAIFVLYKLSKDKGQKVPPNSPLVIFMDKSVSQGYAMGAVLDKKIEYSGRMLISFKPLDLAYDRRGKPVKVKPQTAAVREKLVQRCSVGQVSVFREIWFVAPENLTKLNEEFKETPFGESVSKWAVIKELMDHSAKVLEQTEQLKNIESSQFGKEEHQLLSSWKQLAQDATKINNMGRIEEKK